MTYYVRIEYPEDKAIEAEGETLEQLVDSVNVGIRTLWGQRNFQKNAVTLDQINEWLGWSKQAD